ncbi:hypothetical protein BDC45DRAFT_570415 [Circinella umbellata]|nr:hypothetical protein BDC45DRAFT_570415 [Circinella umbellata]
MCKKVENVPKKTNVCRHYKLVHDIVLPAGKQKQIINANAIPVNHEFICPSCLETFESLEDQGIHLESHIITSVLDTPKEGDGLALTNSLGELVSIIDPRLPHHPVSKPITVVTQSRTYDEAVLHACNVSNTSDQEKCKTLYVVDLLSLRPFSHVDENSYEENGLASQRLMNKISGEYQAIKSILPLKWSFKSMNASICINCSPEIVPALTVTD